MEVTKYRIPIEGGYYETFEQPLSGEYTVVTEVIEPKEGREFVYNNSLSMDAHEDFTSWYKFNLTPTADIDANGDKSKITWRCSSGEIAIEEFPVYTRTSQGTGLLRQLFLKRTLTIRYYKKNGYYIDIVMPERTYNEHERKIADTKSRTNIIERTRQTTGEYIYGKNVTNGTPQNIETELNAALELLETLQKEISVYRNDREHTPLITALQNTAPTALVPQDVIDFIINKVNIEYYA